MEVDSDAIPSPTSMPPPPKRAIRTYGRPKEPGPAPEPASALLLPRSSTPPPNRSKTRWSPPPTADGASHASFGFAWRKKLAAIDAQYDSGDEETSYPAPGTSKTSADETPTSPIQEALPIDNPSPLPAPPASRRRVSNRIAFSDQDSDREPPLPPSEDELPEHVLVADSRPKAKTKPVSSRAPLAFNDAPVPGHRKRVSEANAKPKLKAPTKKDIEETRRDRGRLAASTKAGVQPAEKSTRFTKFALFQNLVGVPRTSSIDDPITAFSSSPQPPPIPAPREEEGIDAPLPFVPPKPEPKADELPSLDSSDDEELPDVAVLLSGVNEQRERAQRQQELAAMKLKLVAQRAAAVLNADDDDDDLVVEARPKAKSEKKPRLSEARKRQMQVSEYGRAGGSKAAGTTHDQLVKQLKHRVEQENAKITNEKESEWARRGGNVMAVAADANQNSAMMSEAIKVIAEKGRLNAEAQTARMQIDDGEEEEESDEDWTEEADVTMVDEDKDEEAPVPTKSRSNRRIVDSDDDGEDDPEVPSGQNQRVSSTDEQTEDEGDKENDIGFSFDPTADKENRAIQRQPLGALQRPHGLGRQGSLFGLEEGFNRSMSMSPGDAPISDGENENDENAPVDKGEDRRRPLRLPSDEDPFTSESPSRNLDFAERLKQSSPTSTQPGTPELTLRPTLEPEPLGSKFKSIGGLSQFSDEGSFTKHAALQPGFSDLFESGSELQQRRPLGRGTSFMEKSGLFGQLRNSDHLNLTQDVDLQPAFKVGDRLREQAETIFLKEQEYVLELASKTSEKKQPQPVYINENGFLTQTRPQDEEEPELYRPSSPSWDTSAQLSPSSSQTQPQTQPGSVLSSLRIPLRTLSLKAGDLSSPDSDSLTPSPRRRLVKGQRPLASPTASPTRRQSFNAFDALQGKAPQDKRKGKEPLKKSVFIEGEAEESDDDEMALFRSSGDGDGDEEDGEDQDQTLVTLVDDQEMDDKTAARDAVIEKFQEQLNEDDIENEKLHQAVTRGDLRKKRRIGGGLDDSDDDEDGDDFRAKRMRRGLYEPQIERGDIKELAKNPSTVAFFQVYADDLKAGDEGEFAYLQEETQPQASEDAQMGSDEEEEREIVTTSEIRRQAQEMARTGQLDELASMDAEDTSWIDKDMDEEEETQTKFVSISRAQMRKRPSNNAIEQARMHKWHKTEARSRNAGTGRASGRTAVTAQKPSVRPQPANKPADTRRPVKQQPSILAGVATDRSMRFE
ncbi:MRC1-like domain-containing protein [Mycena amicta]|nr:MRC1-like domain-containing protein [Mycena amicta]